MNNTFKLTATNQLPEEIPLILLRGAVLLPKAQLPIPIFENIQSSMINHLFQDQKLIGLVQPNSSIRETTDLDSLDLFSIGTLARIVEINEIERGKLIAFLEGVCRFEIVEKWDTLEGYPLARVNYERFVSDLADENDFTLDRNHLIEIVKPYFKRLDINLNLEEVDKSSNQKLITALTMACPFRPSEKQILLETQNFKEQSTLITTLIEMAAYSGQNDVITYH